ncbi:hypothetical protein [Methylobacterium ajmalii]|uniref:hypothetical protein n=1 Tax=Methylobacterium ajmalii TaxID=2738439 RepID=UPI002F35B684
MLNAMQSAALVARSPRRPVWERENPLDITPGADLDLFQDDLDGDLSEFREQRRRRVAEESEH